MKLRECVEKHKELGYDTFCFVDPDLDVVLFWGKANEYTINFYGEQDILKAELVNEFDDLCVVWIYIHDLPQSAYDDDMERGRIDDKYDMYVAVNVTNKDHDREMIFLNVRTLREAQNIMVERYNAERKRYFLYEIDGMLFFLDGIQFGPSKVERFSYDWMFQEVEKGDV